MGMIAHFILALGLNSNPFSSTCLPKLMNYGDGDFTVNVSKYSPALSTQKTLVIFPPTGKTNFIDQRYARVFCQSGYEVLILNSWTGDEGDDGDLGSHQRYYGRAQRAMGLALDQIHTPFIGVLGTSLGALFAAMSASLYPQINAVFSIVGGAPISSIIAESDQKALRGLFENRKLQYGFKNIEEYKHALEEKIQYDPLKMAKPPKKMYLGMIVGDGDETVPTTYQKNLKVFWQPRFSKTISGDHRGVIIKTWLFHTHEILDFFNSAAKF